MQAIIAYPELKEKGKKFVRVWIKIYFSVYQITNDEKRVFLNYLKENVEKFEGVKRAAYSLNQIKEIMITYKSNFFDNGIINKMNSCYNLLSKQFTYLKVYFFFTIIGTKETT